MKLFKGARKHRIDRVAGQSIAGNSVARNVLALQDFEADANGARKNDVSGNDVGESQSRCFPILMARPLC